MSRDITASEGAASTLEVSMLAGQFPNGKISTGTTSRGTTAAVEPLPIVIKDLGASVMALPGVLLPVSGSLSAVHECTDSRSETPSRKIYSPCSGGSTEASLHLNLLPFGFGFRSLPLCHTYFMSESMSAVWLNGREPLSFLSLLALSSVVAASHLPAKPRPSLSRRICLTDGKIVPIFQDINSFWLSVLTKVEHLSAVLWPSSEALNGDRVNPNTSSHDLQQVVRSQSRSDNVLLMYLRIGVLFPLNTSAGFLQ
ncbi:unnamed protein product [Leuciscus chuanchicus]